MKRYFKIFGFTALGLIAVIAVALAVASLRVEYRRNKVADTAVRSIAIPTDEASLREGQRLVTTKACSDCHDTDLGGKTFVNAPPVGVFSGPNLTKGKGSRTAEYTDLDWIRSIRNGVDPKGRKLVMMPSGDFHRMSDQEMGMMIAYLKSIAPVDRESLPQHIGPVARILYNLGQMPLLFSAELIDIHDNQPESVVAQATVEYGKYVSMACSGCHGDGFSGGHIPGTPPEWPDAKNLTPSGSFAKYNFDDFKRVLTQGVTPNGHQINPQFMPWKATAAMTETELSALFMYLKQIPERKEGTR